MGDGGWEMGYGLRVMGYGLRVWGMGYGGMFSAEVSAHACMRAGATALTLHQALTECTPNPYQRTTTTYP